MNAALFIAIFIAADTIIVTGVILGVVHFILRPLAEKHPAQPPAEDAVRRNFQSFRIDWVNLGFSIHVAADERYLHLTPARFFRWCGARAMSIPWEAMEYVEPKVLKRWPTVKVGRTRICGPAWCLSLANPGTPDGDDDLAAET